MKILVVSPKNKTVFNFRGDLIKEMIAAGHKVIVSGPDQQFKDDILNLGVEHFFEVPLVKDNTGIAGDLKYLHRLAALMKREKPDIVFSYNIKPVVYGSMAAKMAGIKRVYALVAGLGRVYSSSTSVKAKALRVITNTLYKRAFTCCKRVMFQNTDDMQEFVQAGLLKQEKCVHVNGSGVNMTRFQRQSLPAAHVFIFIGRLIREKGVLNYCQAAAMVKRKHPDARFILLGGYDSSLGAIKPEDLEPYFSSGAVEYPGEVKDVNPILRTCRYFVLPTYYREGVPRTILEAMALGLPIITTDWPGCRDAVQDGVNGQLVQPQDSECLAQAMNRMIEFPDMVTEMSNQSYRLCCEKYDVRKVNDSMLKAMEIRATEGVKV